MDPSKVLLSISVVVVILSNKDHGLHGTDVPARQPSLPQGMPQSDASRMMSQQGAPFGHPSSGARFQPGAPGFPGAMAPGIPPGHVHGYNMPGVDLNNPFVAETLKSLAKVTELAISGVSLPNKDSGSQSDPFCVTELRAFNAAPEAWIKFHQTETVWDDLNPEFPEKPLIPPSYGDKYSIKFTLFDADMNSKNHDLLGYAECSLKELLAKPAMELWLKVKPRNQREITSTTSKIVIRTEQLIDNNNEIRLTTEGAGIKKVNHRTFGSSSSDPYLAVYKRTPADAYTMVYRTEVKKGSVTPTWAPFTIPFRSLCNGDEQRTLKFVCMDKQRKKPDKLIGSFDTTYERLRDKSVRQESDEFRNEKNEPVGHLRYKLELQSYPTFTEYLRSGVVELNVNIAIDFSITNKPINKPDSLHFLHGNGAPNQYQQAIHAVVGILEAYDFNKFFPVFGFGAQIGTVGHDAKTKMFPLDPTAAEHPGVNGVLEAYRQFLARPNIKFSSPVLFAPVIRQMVDNLKIQLKQNPRAYFILVILTAGEINDLAETEEVIREARALPLSILIVGVGEDTGSKFEDMEKLDGDHIQKTSNNISTRDIVQFVAISQHVSAFVDTSTSLALAKELLAELPSQVIVYMKLASLMHSTAPQHSGFHPPMSMYSGALPPQYSQPAMMGPNLTSLQSNIFTFPQVSQYQNTSQPWPPTGGYAAAPANIQSAPPQGSQPQFSRSFAPQNLPPDAYVPQNATSAAGETGSSNFVTQTIPPDASVPSPEISKAQKSSILVSAEETHSS